MSFSRLTLPELKLAAIKVVGRRSELSHRVPIAWLELVNRLEGIPNKVDPELLYDAGLQAEMLSGRPDEVYTRYIGVGVNSFEHLPAGFIPLTIPARTYAMTAVRGTAEQIDAAYIGLFSWINEQGLSADPEAFGLDRYDTRRQRVTPPYERFDYDTLTALRL